MSGWSHFKNTEMMAGYAASKGVKNGKIAVLGSGVLLVLGGLGIVLGSAIPLAVLCIVIFLLPVSFMMHAYWKDTDAMQKMSNRINFMKNMALLGAALIFLMIPSPWIWSLF